jgi:hypothetical protein
MENPGLFYIEPTGEWMVLADRSVHKTREAALGHLNADAINLELRAFGEYLEATAADDLYRPAKPAGVVEKGPRAGQMREASPEYRPDERAVKTYVSKMLSGAKRYLAWKHAQQG